MNDQEELEIDLVDLLVFLKKKLLIIILGCIICASVAFAFSKYVLEPTYVASTRIYVLNKTGSQIASSDLTSSAQILDDYKVLITGVNVTREVIKNQHLEISDEALAKKIKVSVPSGTRILQIDVEDHDPKLAAAIANDVRKIASRQIDEITNTDAVNLIYEAVVPLKPSGPNIIKNSLLAGMVGIIIVCAFYIIKYMLDDTIKSEEDVEHYLGLSTLGIIPMSKDLNLMDNKEKHKRIRRNKKK